MNSITTHPETQMDFAHPEHVSVILKDGKLNVNIKDHGMTYTVSANINAAPKDESKSLSSVSKSEAMTSLRMLKVTERKESKLNSNADRRFGAKHFRWNGPTPKLSTQEVREIKMMLSDADFMSKYRNVTEAYKEIGKAYNVTGCAIGNIARGIAWKHIVV